MTPAAYRAAFGLSVQQMAQLVGITRQGWYRAEQTGIVSEPLARLLAYIERYGPELAREMIDGAEAATTNDEATRAPRSQAIQGDKPPL